MVVFVFVPVFVVLVPMGYFCPALTKLALDLHVNFCVCVFLVFFSRRLIGSNTGF